MSTLARVARALARPLEVANAEAARADAIVVLGSPVRPDGALSAIGEERVLAALELYRARAAPIVLFTGAREAEPMASRAFELGLPAEAAMLETVSRTTRENAERAAELLTPVLSRRSVRKPEGFSGRPMVWVVSQPFHLRRACFIFRRAGLDPLPFALDDGVQIREPRLALKWSIREYVAWAKAGLEMLW